MSRATQKPWHGATSPKHVLLSKMSSFSDNKNKNMPVFVCVNVAISLTHSTLVTPCGDIDAVETLYNTINFCWSTYKQRFLTPGHQGWNDLHRLCRIGMEYHFSNNNNNNNDINNNNNNNNNNDDNDNNDNNNNNNNNNKTMMMIIIIIIRMMTMMIIGTTTIMIMIIIITTTLTMTIMKMIMIKTAQTPCQSLYKDRRIQNKIAWYNWYNRDDVMLILYEMLHTCSIMHTQWRCKFENTKHRCLRMFLHRFNLHCSDRN